MPKPVPNSTPKSIKAAAIQLEAVVGDVATNLGRLEVMIKEAVSQGAKLIAVPEFCTSRLPMSVSAAKAVLPTDNLVVDLFKGLAAKYQCWIGGSMLVYEAGEVYNRYHFFEPNGDIHTHDKDFPTMWEGCFYTGGDDDGVFETELGGVGAAVCWELIRNGTARRLLNRVGVAITGTHWWSVPSNLWPLNKLLTGLGEVNRQLSIQAPVEFAQRVGVPVIQASHCGEFNSHLLLIPGLPLALPYRTEYVGATQIVDAQGKVLAKRDTREGAGIVYAEIELGAQEPLKIIEEDFWMPKLPWLIRAYWGQQNACAKPWYNMYGREAGIAATLSYLEHANAKVGKK